MSDLYVDRTYLRILLKPYDEGYSETDLVRFLFQTRLNSIETTNQDENGNLLVSPMLIGSKQNYIRFSIKPFGHPACKSYDYPTRYPALAMPWLRQLGLKEDSCVAVETSSGRTATTGIHVKEQLISSQYKSSNRQNRLYVELRDSSGVSPDVAASMVVLYGSGGGGQAGIHYFFPCDTGASQVKAFREAFSSKGSLDISPPTLVDVPPHELPVSYQQADENWLGTFRWISKPGRSLSSALINEEGTVWIGRKFTDRSEVPTFNSLFEGKIFSSPVPVPRPGQDITGLARTSKGYAIISTMIHRPNDPHYVFEFNTRGKLLSVFELSNSQYSALTEKK